MANATELQVVTTPQLIEYKGQPVLTLKMIDDIHQRPKGTAKRAFTACKKHLTNDEDFYLVDFSQKDEFRTFEIQVPPRGLTVITVTGYMMLVKSFNDALAWKIQKHLVLNYFNARTEQPAQPDPRMIGAPLLNDTVQKEINRWAKVLQGRTYSHYKNRLLEEALKDFPQTPAEIERLAETVWYNERTREEIDGIPVTTLKRAYELCINYFNGYNQNLPEHLQYTHRQCWEQEMRAFGETVRR